MNFYLFLLLMIFPVFTSIIYWINYAKGKTYRELNKRHGYNKLENKNGVQTTAESYGESVQFITLSADENGNSYNYIVF